MSLLEVLRFPDPRLRKMSKAVENIDPELVQFSENMLETMYDFRGIGLAAPQVGRLERLVVIDTRGTKDEEGRYKNDDMTELEQAVPQPLVLINPEITHKEGKTTYDEGCLSVPSFFETVERYEYIEMTALNEKGEKFKVKTDGLLSICIQHEIDHLDGKLFIDRLSPIKANRIKSKIKKEGYPTPEEMRAREDEREEL